MIPESDPSSHSFPGSNAPVPSQRNRQAKRVATDGLGERNGKPGECRFIFVRWPGGNWTIALDREYAPMEMDEF